MDCLVCGKPIRYYTRKKYCSLGCAAIATSEYQRAYKVKKNRLKNGIVYKKICLSCGIEFAHVNKTKRYCTSECRRKKQKRKRQAARKKIEVICVICGVQFHRKYSRSKTCGDVKCVQTFLSGCHNRSEAVKQAQLSGKTVHYRGESVDTKCPMCGVLYPRFYNPGWIGNGMPRVMCDKCSALGSFRSGADDMVGHYEIGL